MEMNQLILSLGSNIHSRSSNLKEACKMISTEIGSIVKYSSVYNSPPLGFESETTFLNCCILVETILNPADILSKTQAIEISLGRTVKSIEKNYSSRTIDIDLIFYNDEVIQWPELTIPHQLFRERNFVLKPLNDLVKDFIDPISYLTVEQLLSNCKDKSVLTIQENKFLDTL